MFKGVLKFDLLVVVAGDGVGGGADDLALITDTVLEFAVVKLAPVGLSSGVVDVLHVDEEGDFFHGLSCGCSSLWCLITAYMRLRKGGGMQLPLIIMLCCVFENASILDQYGGLSKRVRLN